MDPAFALTHLERPAIFTAEVAILPGAAGPVVIPLSWLPAAVRARWLLDDPRAPLAARVSAALDAGLDEAAWNVLRARTEPLEGDLRLEHTLDGWAQREALRLGLPPGRGELYLAMAGGACVAAPNDQALGLGDARVVLAALAWPRWRGQVLAVTSAERERLPPTQNHLARPVLPIIRLSDTAGQSRREAVAAATVALALDLTTPPADGWPAWLRIGLSEVAAGMARGEGPSPRAMHERRKQAGERRIGALFTAPDPDRALAMAVCAPLVHSKRRHLLPNLLDPLRNGSTSVAALAIAYGLTPALLVSER